MRLIGVRHDGAVLVAALVDGAVAPLAEVSEFWGDPHRYVTEEHVERAELLSRDGVELVPPVRPDARVLCVGLNYADHVAEGPFSVPDHPTIFGRWTASLAVSAR